MRQHQLDATKCQHTPAVASLPTWPRFQFPVSKFEAFDAATEEWGVYQERLE